MARDALQLVGEIPLAVEGTQGNRELHAAFLSKGPRSSIPNRSKTSDLERGLLCRRRDERGAVCAGSTARAAFAALCGSSLLLTGCGGPSAAETKSAPPPVTVAVPVERVVTDYEDYTGRTAAIESVDIIARVTGYLEKIYFHEGTEVNDGNRPLRNRSAALSGGLRPGESTSCAKRSQPEVGTVECRALRAGVQGEGRHGPRRGDLPDPGGPGGRHAARFQGKSRNGQFEPANGRRSRRPSAAA